MTGTHSSQEEVDRAFEETHCNNKKRVPTMGKENWYLSSQVRYLPSPKGGEPEFLMEPKSNEVTSHGDFHLKGNSNR